MGQTINITNATYVIAIAEFKGQLQDLRGLIAETSDLPAETRASAAAELDKAIAVAGDGKKPADKKEVKAHLEALSGILESAGKVAGSGLALGKAVAAIGAALGL